jgi:hypothetical protein
MTAPAPQCQPITNEPRKAVAGRERQIPPDEAKEIALRLIAGAFGRTDLDKRPRFSIPCKPWDDDDCLIIEFIKQSTTLTARVEELLAIVEAIPGTPNEMPSEPCDELCGNSWCNEFGCIANKIRDARAVLQPKRAV